MRITYDKEADAAYIYVVDKIGKGEAKMTCSIDKKVSGMVNLDFDAAGRLLGIELIPGSRLLSKEVLSSARRIDSK